MAGIYPAGGSIMLTVVAPAKLNLTLEVLGKRRDGFHEIRSVIQAINLSDNLRCQLSRDVTFKSNMPDWVPEESLVSRAVSLLRETTGSDKGATIDVRKSIPLLSGLGGDSSDAAAVLRGLNQLWELGLSDGQLLELAWQLGSDVAFFLDGDTALVEGRGEIVTPLPPLSHRWVVLAMPPLPRLPGKTGRLYASLNAAHYTDGQITRRLVEEIRAGRELTPSLLYNAFENVAFSHFAELSVYWRYMAETGATDVHLTGSGPALFTLIKDREQAEDLSIRLQLQQQGLEVYLTDTLPGIEKVE